jgi:hypothetical protein
LNAVVISTAAAEASIHSVVDLNGFSIGVLETMAEVSSGSAFLLSALSI